MFVCMYVQWRSKKLITDAKDGDTINIVTKLIMTSNYTENKQKTNLNILWFLHEL